MHEMVTCLEANEGFVSLLQVDCCLFVASAGIIPAHVVQAASELSWCLAARCSSFQPGAVMAATKRVLLPSDVALTVYIGCNYQWHPLLVLKLWR